MITYIADWVACRPRTIFYHLLIEIFLLILILAFKCRKPELCISFCFSCRSGPTFFILFAISHEGELGRVFLVNNNYTNDPWVIQIQYKLFLQQIQKLKKKEKKGKKIVQEISAIFGYPEILLNRHFFIYEAI